MTEQLNQLSTELPRESQASTLSGDMQHAVGELVLDTPDRLEHPDHLRLVSDLTGTPFTEGQALAMAAEDLRERRAAILALPSHEEGLQMDRVDGFCDRMGIRRRAERILTPENYRQALAIAGYVEGHDSGTYLAGMDVVLVKRDPELEALNGPEYTEGAVIHERTHRTDSAVTNVTANIDWEAKSVVFTTDDERNGFASELDGDTPKGLLLEEGIPELARGMYVVDELYTPDGLAGKILDTGKSHPLDKYGVLVKKPSGEIRKDAPPGALSAAIFEELIRQDPEILATLLDIRRSAEESELLERMDKIRPGLFNAMMQINTNTTSGVQEAAKLFHSIYG